MAIDSTLFGVSLPAAAYAVGDRVPLRVLRGPAVVRDGYGKAYLKKIFTITDKISTPLSSWKIVIKNSNWIDSVSNPVSQMNDTSLAETSASIQRGHDSELTANSGWEVVAECIAAGTETAAQDLLCLIDIDYPAVAAVENPLRAKGTPVTIDGIYTAAGTAVGDVSQFVWNTYNVDIFKAGFRYLLVEACFRDANTAAVGFLSISGAAGQAGLERIIPCRNFVGGMRYLMDYSTPLVKGPMNINLLSLGATGAMSPYVYFDFVKKA